MPRPRKRPKIPVNPAQSASIESKIDSMGEYLRELKNGSTNPEEAAIRIIQKGRLHITSESYWRIVHELITEVLPQCDWHGQTITYDIGPGDCVTVNNAEEFSEKYLSPLLGKAFDVAQFVANYGNSALSGAKQLQQIAITQSELRQQSSTQLAQEANPAKEDGRKTKKGEVRNPSGSNQYAKPSAEDYSYYNKNNPDQKKGKWGDSPEYLAQRVAKASPEVHSRMKRGEFSSTRAAAIAAGIVKPRVQVTWKADADADAIAGAISRKVSPDMLSDVIQSLTNRSKENE